MIGKDKDRRVKFGIAGGTLPLTDTLVTMKFISPLILAAIFLSGCGGQAPAPEETDPSAVQTEQYGGSVATDEAISYESLLDLMKEAGEATVVVKARVESVCQTKGCWMTVKSDDPAVEETMFVQFEDYGFFMPKDLSGAEVIMAGMAYREVTTVEELRHYAQDEGQSAEEIAAITEPLDELKFMATGVVVTSR